MALLTLLAVRAQEGLEIKKIFGGKYVSDASVTETIMNGDQRYLRNHKLNTLATFKGDAATYESIIQPLVLSDAKKATGRDIRYRKGSLQYAFLVLKPVNSKEGKKDKSVTVNRYLYYLKTESGRRTKSSVMVIYLEGPLQRAEAERVISNLKR